MTFLVVDTSIGPITRLDRLTDGSVMCCMCMEFVHPDSGNLYVDLDGQMWDYCIRCACMDHPTRMTWPA